MRNVVIWGAVLVCAAVVFSGVQAQRTIAPGEEVGARTPDPVPVTVANKPEARIVDSVINVRKSRRPVEVTGTVNVGNFPMTQNVVGTVSIGNLPATQPVSGMVDVGNLPLDAGGRLLVAIQGGSSALVLRSTTATYQGDLGGRTGATAKCRIEFPGSHLATATEIATAWNERGIVWLSSETNWSWVDDLNNAKNCYEWQAVTNQDGSRIDGNLVRTKGSDLFNSGPCSDANPILCAE